MQSRFPVYAVGCHVNCEALVAKTNRSLHALGDCHRSDGPFIFDPQFIGHRSPAAVYRECVITPVACSGAIRLEKRRRKLERAGIEMPVIALVMDGALMRVRADLAWLEHIERKIIREF